MEWKEALRLYRQEKGLSQEELATQLGVSRQTVSKWETGAATPSADNLYSLSLLYGVSMETLYEGKKRPEQPLPEENAPGFEVSPKLPERTRNNAVWFRRIAVSFLAVFALAVGIVIGVILGIEQGNTPVPDADAIQMEQMGGEEPSPFTGWISLYPPDP